MDIAKLLCTKFLREERFKADEGCGIITSADSKFFPCFQVWYYSIYLQNEVPITVFDLGMTNKQLSWAESQLGLDVIPLSDFKSDLLFATNRDHWENWDKPLFFMKSPYPKTLWLDSDIVACQPLGELFAMMEEGITLFECQNGWGGVNDLHHKLHTNYTPHQSGPPYMNNGVLGIYLEREKDLLEKWEFGVARCAENIDVERSCPCWDQGALQWAVECLGILEVVKRDFQWNWCQDINPSYRANASDYIGSIDLTRAKLLHYSGGNKWVEHNKPFWTDWEEVPIDLDADVLERCVTKYLEWLEFTA